MKVKTNFFLQNGFWCSGLEIEFENLKDLTLKSFWKNYFKNKITKSNENFNNLFENLYKEYNFTLLQSASRDIQTNVDLFYSFHVGMSKNVFIEEFVGVDLDNLSEEQINSLLKNGISIYNSSFDYRTIIKNNFYKYLRNNKDIIEERMLKIFNANDEDLRVLTKDDIDYINKFLDIDNFMIDFTKFNFGENDFKLMDKINKMKNEDIINHITCKNEDITIKNVNNFFNYNSRGLIIKHKENFVYFSTETFDGITFIIDGEIKSYFIDCWGSFTQLMDNFEFIYSEEFKNTISSKYQIYDEKTKNRILKFIENEF